MNNSRAYESVSFCQKHGYVKGKIRIRHTEEDRYYVIKTLKNVGDEKAEEIREKGIPSAKETDQKTIREADLRLSFWDSIWQFQPDVH